MPTTQSTPTKPVQIFSSAQREPRQTDSEKPERASVAVPTDTFVHRHIGPDADDVRQMLATIGAASLDALIESTIPGSIRLGKPLNIGGPRGEHELLQELKSIADKNQVFRSFIGMGYYGTITPPVIQRNILENPGWYTQYTPYQAEIAQGRLEALLNFQTMVSDLTALPLAQASLLDEATAAAEAMAMCVSITDRKRFIVADDCHPQTIAVVQTRGESMGVEIAVREARDDFEPADDLLEAAGVLLQYPTTDGRIECYRKLAQRLHDAGGLVVAATDLLALTLIKPPGEWGADIAVGSTQRFGVPMGFGGPHAAFLATKTEYARKMPGRLIGVSRDVHGDIAYRMAIQTREQHIKRDRATSNICTAQVLLAIMAGMYAVYHGPEGLKRIAGRVHALTQMLRAGLLRLGHRIDEDLVFDTLRVRPAGTTVDEVIAEARSRGMNMRNFGDGTLGIALEETADASSVANLLACFGAKAEIDVESLARSAKVDFPPVFARSSPFLTHPVFNAHHSETEMLRYIKKLEACDLSLAQSMIPLGSCTMKLNATSEMLPVTWAEFANMHPFAPAEQWRGYAELFAGLEKWLGEIAGLPHVSLQPNAGSQGEYAGLLVIHAYHAERGQRNRDVCLIPVSAHGTNPASAVIAGFKVVVVACDDRGNVDIADLRAKAAENAHDLGAIMITYPSTHGVYEEGIREICDIVHQHGGLVYMDGANMNAQVGLTSPGEIGADVCHLNLHKTFCIPHGGGGPGMGPICVTAKLAPYLPGHPVSEPASAGPSAIGPVAAAPYGSPAILTIPWVYIALMGGEGLKRASEIAILNANYMAARLKHYYDVLYANHNGRVAHEFILDCRAFEASADIKVDDIAKRLMDYGFHAPTMSFPVPGTLMIEPTESESRAELDRFCEAMISIRKEIADIEQGQADRGDNVLKHAPHTARAIGSDSWAHAYGREQAAYPAPWLREYKFWPAVGRIDNPYGDRNLFCTCPPINGE